MQNTLNSKLTSRVIIWVSLIVINLFLAGCGKPEVTPTVPMTDKVQSSTYDANSWKSIIPPNCLQFFDGCNNCRRDLDSEVAACTRKACFEYQKPMCLDEAPQAMTSPDTK